MPSKIWITRDRLPGVYTSVDVWVAKPTLIDGMVWYADCPHGITPLEDRFRTISVRDCVAMFGEAPVPGESFTQITE